MESGLQELLEEFTDLELNSRTKRIRCKLSGHEMPCNVRAVKSYVTGKKFKELSTKSKIDFNVDSLEPLIVPSTIKKRSLFCCLTGKYINCTCSQVDKHVNGRKYKMAKSEYETGHRELIHEVTRSKVEHKEDCGEDSGEVEEMETSDSTREGQRSVREAKSHKLRQLSGSEKERVSKVTSLPLDETIQKKSVTTLRKRKSFETDLKSVTSKRKRLLLEKRKKTFRN